MQQLYRRLGMMVMLIVLSSSTLLAQRTVTGNVIDEYNEGLPGVTIQVKGTATGTATDANGNFSIEVPGNDAILVFSFIGYFAKEEVVGNRSTINVEMVPDVQTLTEMVVTGYAVQEKRDITGAVGTVKREELLAVPAATVENQLQGRLAGVNVTNSGQPGAASTVRV
jgi:TonB-dependent starch-binding outer membrane protein SusC